MKGSPIKLGSIKGTSGHASALKQKTLTSGETTYSWDSGLDDKYLFPDLDQPEVARGGDMYKRKKGSKFSHAGEARWIRNNYGPTHSLDKKTLKDARRAYYDAMQGSTSDNPTETEQTPEEKGGRVAYTAESDYNPSELTKSLDKGYFNIGKGSEYFETKPKPENFSTFEEYQTALRRHQADHPDVNPESP